MAISEEQINDYRRRYGQIVARAWSDDDYKARFLANPATVLREVGIDLAGRVQVKAVENTPHLLHLVIPPSDVSEEDLAQVAGGLTMGTAGTAGTAPPTSRGPTKLPSSTARSWPERRPRTSSSDGCLSIRRRS